VLQLHGLLARVGDRDRHAKNRLKGAQLWPFRIALTLVRPPSAGSIEPEAQGWCEAGSGEAERSGRGQWARSGMVQFERMEWKRGDE
jgi:hypothetical protein